jgi:16S rRNA processing protein RimM
LTELTEFAEFGELLIVKREDKKNSINLENSPDPELVSIAKIVKARGLRGEVAAVILTDFPERFENLKTVFLVKPDGARDALEIENFWFQNDRIVLKFEGIDSIEAAETLRSAEICVPETDSVQLEADEYFDWQLEDCEVETIDGTKIGRVKEVMRTGGTEILIVAGAEKEFLIPFAEKICTSVDVAEKLIKIDAPEGLLDF